MFESPSSFRGAWRISPLLSLSAIWVQALFRFKDKTELKSSSDCFFLRPEWSSFGHKSPRRHFGSTPCLSFPQQNIIMEVLAVLLVWPHSSCCFFVHYQWSQDVLRINAGPPFAEPWLLRLLAFLLTCWFELFPKLCVISVSCRVQWKDDVCPFCRTKSISENGLYAFGQMRKYPCGGGLKPG